ncbi:hypothetical protein CTheo_4281 [Ceratobasidium theobromae]|uniref:Methyltransferase domain-containing protein n=1 Tax=Ceratobasidium theobromae TaxID=1582974 RepID=A0A5N5QKW8_9AGAM|nr:hypothetical protein CTheo_4281 [Ceratobasidium theobromae]
MATPYYDPDTEGIVYVVRPYAGGCDQDDSDSDMETISSASTARTTSTITSEEVGDYFREAYGRTYAHDENLPLMYPIDDIETRRHQMQHVFLKALVHGNYIGPVQDVLRPRADGSRPRILDIRTCAGNWAQDMAAEFPHCDITSIDIAPIASHTPRANITFEIYDLYAGVAEPDESFDYVKEYDRLIFDLHRVLKPGGLITICEVENQVYDADQPLYDIPAYQTFPDAARALQVLRIAAEKQGIDIDAIHHFHEWIQPNSPFWTHTAEKYGIPSPRREITTRGFRDVHKQIVLMPVGAWHSDPAVQQVGDLIARGFSLAWKQLEPSLIDSGTPPEEASRICSAIIEAYSRSDFHVVGKYHMVYGTKN